MSHQKGFSLLELLLSLFLGLFLISVLLKLFIFQETLHRDVSTISTLNRHALTVRLLLSHEINSGKVVQILNKGDEIKVDNKLFYISKNSLYVKKDQDVSVELMPDVKNLTASLNHSQLDITVTVYILENQNEKNEKSGIYINHSITLHFFTQPHCIFNTGNQCE